MYHARVLFPTLAHGNSKKEGTQRNRSTKRQVKKREYIK